MPSAAESPAPLVYSPRSLAEALALFVPNPHAQVFAGGTSRSGPWAPDLAFPPVLISLHLAEDLRRVVYGERTLDLGAAVTLNQVLAINGPWVPALIKEATRAIGTSALRNLATLGGNLCQPGTLGDLFPPLLLLGAQIEVRNLRGSRWLSAQDVADAGHLTPADAEIVTRIRLPQETWPLVFSEKIGNVRTPWEERISLSGLARTRPGTLEAIRLVFHLPQAGLIRFRDWEAEMAGQTLPLPPRVRSQTLERVEAALSALEPAASAFQRDRVRHMARWVLTRLDDE